MACLSICVGAALGLVVSWIVNCSLIEISVNPFFSFYFGILFILIGGVILFRLRTLDNADRIERKPLLMSFAGMVIVAGFLCFLLDKNMFTLHYMSKVPLYAVLGIAVAFAFSFSIVDVANGIAAACSSSTYAGSAGVVDSPKQVSLLLMSSSLMGALFGFAFGLLDLEDYHGVELRNRLYDDELYFCYPLGIIIGGFAGYMNEKFRSAPPGGYLGRTFRDEDY